MQWNSRFVCALMIAGVAGLIEASAQSTSSATQTRRFEIVAVDGNRVVVRDAQETKEIIVPDDFRLTVDGQPVTVRDLKPGMKGIATITTTTTMTPVVVTEVRNAEVMQASANSVLVRGQNGFRMFSEGEVQKRGIKIYKDGKPVNFTDLHTGDKLTATIVTEGPPKAMTQRQVQASLGSVPPAQTAAAQAPAASQSARAAAAPPPVEARRAPSSGAAAPSTASATAGSVAGSAPAKLPKTASPFPLVGLVGGLSLALAIGLTVRRRRAVAVERV